MDIFNDYTTDNLMLDEPCYINNIGNIYAVTIDKYNKLSKYGNYIIPSKRYYKQCFGDDMSLGILECVLLVGVSIKQMELGLNKEDAVGLVVEELSDLFSIIARDEVLLIDGNDLVFCNNERDFVVDNSNFEILRYIVMKQNLLTEPKVYEDNITAEWAAKVKKARQSKEKPITLGDMINLVRCGIGVSYGDIKKLNILQLQADYYRLCNTMQYETIMLFRTVCDSKDLPDVTYTENIIDMIYDNLEEKLFKEKNSELEGALKS